MPAPRLYLFIGYPGAGKTTVAKTIEEATGAVHLWADNERWQMFQQPTHASDESKQLYDKLNLKTADYLKAGKSVIFDTNFNHRADRNYLRQIAEENGAETVLIWLTTPVEIAHDRAVHSETTRNGYSVNMSHEEFESIVSKLEPPSEDENPVKFDGTELDAEAIKQQFSS